MTWEVCYLWVTATNCERLSIYFAGAGAADSGGGQEGQPVLLEKSKRGKTIFLPSIWQI